MDIFFEQLVKKKWLPVDIAKTIGIILGGLAIFWTGTLVALAYLGPPAISLSFMLLAGLCYGCWWMITNLRVEYEYSATNGNVTVDKIISRRKRKRLVTFEAREIEAFGKYQPEKFQNRQFDHQIDATTFNPEDEIWYAEVPHKTLGRTLLVFCPNERILMAIKPFLKRQVSVDAFGRR